MNFIDAYNKLIKYEGGYVNDPDDPGGETYKGISRRYHPSWEGWKIIEASNGNFSNNEKLEEAVQNFYKENYWDFFDCDNLPFSIASEVFESSINVGKKRATIFIQETIEILLNIKIKVDGIYGYGTKREFKKLINVRGEKLVYNVLNIFQGAWYISLMKSNPVMRKYIGWFKRVEIKDA